MQAWDNVTLFCSLGAFIQLNGTAEAKDFTCSAADRSVVAVDFEMPLSKPNFEVYLDEANYHLPPVCSWIDGWEDHFSTESDMLNEQTFFQVGNDHEELPGYPVGTWKWGTMSCLIGWFNEIVPLSLEWTVNENLGEKRNTTWKEVENWVSGTVLVGCQICTSYPEQNGNIRVSGTFWSAESYRFVGRISGRDNKVKYNGDTYDTAVGTIYVRPDYDDIEDPQNKTIDMYAFISLWNVLPHPRLITDYHLHYDENAEEQETLETIPYYWEEDCAYMNLTSETLPVDSSVHLGITTIEVDITQALCGGGKPVYCFAADRGEMRVDFVC